MKILVILYLCCIFSKYNLVAQEDVFAEPTKTKESHDVSNVALNLKEWIDKKTIDFVIEKFPNKVNGIEQSYLILYVLAGNTVDSICVWKMTDKSPNKIFVLGKNMPRDVAGENFSISELNVRAMLQLLLEEAIRFADVPNRPIEFLPANNNDEASDFHLIYEFKYGEFNKYILRDGNMSSLVRKNLNDEKLVSELNLLKISDILLGASIQSKNCAK